MFPIRRHRLALTTCFTFAFATTWIFWGRKGSLISFDFSRQQDEVQILHKSVSKEKETAPKSPVVSNARSRIVMYNRAPKCGSRSMLSVLARLAQRNNFTEYTSHDYSHKRPRDEYLAQEIKDIAELKPPIVYNRHILYVDFRKYGHEQPIYINMIRDPIDRFSSHYNYMKYGDEMGERDNPMTEWPDINVCVMNNLPVCEMNLPFYEGIFFCGMDPVCYRVSRKRLDMAKKNLEQEYLLVGITEEFENTLKLLEKMLPEYFAGAMEIWTQHSNTKNSTASKKYDVLTPESKEKLRKRNLADEYQLYYSAKRKFDKLKKEYAIK